MALVRIHDDEMLGLLVNGHREAVAALAEQLTAAGVDVDVLVRPARFNVPMASGTLEMIAVSAVSGFAGAALTDLRKTLTRWALRRHRERLPPSSPNDGADGRAEEQTVTQYTLYGPSGAIIKSWIARGHDVPDEGD